jgi:hypothetical protein
MKTAVMKKLYIFSILSLTMFISNSCSKDFLKAYEDRIEGTWKLEDIDKRGIGGDIDNLPFREGGIFEFQNGGALVFTDVNGDQYSGSWDIERAYYEDNYVRSLHLAVVNFTTQQVRSELFEEIRFTGTNRFNGFIRQGMRTYVLTCPQPI